MVFEGERETSQEIRIEVFVTVRVEVLVVGRADENVHSSSAAGAGCC